MGAEHEAFGRTLGIGREVGCALGIRLQGSCLAQGYSVGVEIRLWALYAKV